VILQVQGTKRDLFGPLRHAAGAEMMGRCCHSTQGGWWVQGALPTGSGSPGHRNWKALDGARLAVRPDTQGASAVCRALSGGVSARRAVGADGGAVRLGV